MSVDKKHEEIKPWSSKLESDYASVFPEYHKHMEVVILEQNILLKDVNNFINDLKELKKEIKFLRLENLSASGIKR